MRARKERCHRSTLAPPQAECGANRGREAPLTQIFIAPDEHLTEKVLLRSYQPGDGLELNIATLESYEHLRPWMPWATETQTEMESELLVRAFRARWLQATDFVMAIRTPDDERLIGGCGFHLREGPIEQRAAELGMWIRASVARSGHGTSALEAMLEWGFTHWPWQRLSWRCDAENAASMRMAEKCGLTPEGLLRNHTRNPSGEVRDTACFAILKEEWLASKKSLTRNRD